MNGIRMTIGAHRRRPSHWFFLSCVVQGEGPESMHRRLMGHLGIAAGGQTMSSPQYSIETITFRSFEAMVVERHMHL